MALTEEGVFRSMMYLKLCNPSDNSSPYKMNESKTIQRTFKSERTCVLPFRVHWWVQSQETWPSCRRRGEDNTWTCNSCTPTCGIKNHDAAPRTTMRITAIRHKKSPARDESVFFAKSLAHSRRYFCTAVSFFAKAATSICWSMPDLRKFPDESL